MTPTASTPPVPTFMGTTQVLPKNEVKHLMDQVLGALPALTPFLPDEFNLRVNLLLQRTHPGQLVQYLVAYGYLEQVHKITKDLPKVNIWIGGRGMAGYQRAAGVLVTPLEGDEGGGPIDVRDQVISNLNERIISMLDEAPDVRDQVISNLNERIISMLRVTGADVGVVTLSDPVGAIKARMADLAAASSNEPTEEQRQLRDITQVLHLDLQDPVRSANALALGNEAYEDFCTELALHLNVDDPHLYTDMLAKVADLKNYQQTSITEPQLTEPQLSELLRAAGVRDCGDPAEDYEALLLRIQELNVDTDESPKRDSASTYEGLLNQICELLNLDPEDPTHSAVKRRDSDALNAKLITDLLVLLFGTKTLSPTPWDDILQRVEELQAKADRQREDELQAQADQPEPCKEASDGRTTLALDMSRAIDNGIALMTTRLCDPRHHPSTAYDPCEVSIAPSGVLTGVGTGLAFKAKGYDAIMLRLPVAHVADDWTGPVVAETQDLLLIAAWNCESAPVDMAKIDTLEGHMFTLQRGMTSSEPDEGSCNF